MPNKLSEKYTLPYDDVNAFNQIANFANDLSKDDRTFIATKVLEGYEVDKNSRDGWEQSNKEFMELAKQIGGERTYGGEKVSNVRYPILATAAIQFSARAYPNIVKGTDVVKCQTVGNDASGEKTKKGNRIRRHMSYQILNRMDSWEEDMDQLLMTLALVGCHFKKTYYDPNAEKPVCEGVFAEDLVVHYNAKSLEKAARITHVIELSENEIVERIRKEVFREFDHKSAKGDDDKKDTEDEDAPHTFLEQHCWFDLDDDGYKEPYIVTVHKGSEELVRIVPRYDIDGIKTSDKKEIIKIEPNHHFTQYWFMPSFDGGFYKMGFGALLTSPIHIVNTIFNQLLDAGTLANRQGGFLGPGINLKKGGASGSLVFKQGEWKKISYLGDDIRKAIFALPVKEPSNVLFQLLGLMLDAIKELSSQAEVLSGEQSKANVPATTTLALIEQGLAVFSAIYKRIYRSLKSEFAKIRRLNMMYLSKREYNIVLDEVDENGQPVQFDPKEDYNDVMMDVVPVSNAADISDTQRILKSQALMEIRGQGLNDMEIMRRHLVAMGIEDIAGLLPDPNQPPPPDPKIEVEKEKLRLKSVELQIEIQRSVIEEKEKMSKILKNWSGAVKDLAQAEAAEEGAQLEMYKLQVQELSDKLGFFSNMMGQLQKGQNEQGRVRGVESAQNNQRG